MLASRNTYPEIIGTALVFLEPVLFDAGQRGQPRVAGLDFAPAVFRIEVGAAGRAKAPAVNPANDFHGQRKADLLGQHVSQKHSLAAIIANFTLFLVYLNLSLFANRSHRSVGQVEIPADLFFHRLETPRARHFHARRELAKDANRLAV